EIKLLRSELGNLRKLSETRLQHTKLQAHEQIAKLEKELKLAKNTQGESQNHSQDEIKRLKAALYEEQENAATISTRKLETEHALTKLAEQLNILKKQDEQRQSELKSAQENVIALEQAELAANTAVEQLQAQLLTAEALNNDTNNSRQEQIDQLTSELSEAIDSRKEIESQLHALQQTVEALTENEQQAKQAVEAHLNGIKQLDAKLSEATDTCKHLEEQVHSAQETINALAQDQQQSAKKIQDRLQEIEHLNKKLEEANTAQRQADQEASILRGKLEGSKEAQIEVVSKLKQQIENASAQHQQTNNEREALRTQLSIAEQELSEKQNTVNDLANNIAENKSAIEALTKDRDAALNEKTHLVETLESLKSALNEANNKNDLRIKELTTKVEDSHRSNQSLQQDNNELKLKLEDSSRETERLQVSISGEIDAEIGCLLEEVKIKSSELTRLQSEIDNSTQKTQQLEDKISGLENQLQENQNVYGDRIAELDTALMKSQDAHSVAEESANDHLKSLAQLDEQLKTKENELEKNHERLHTLEQTQQSLQEQIKNYESQLEALQLSQGDSKELTLHLETLNTKNESLCDDLATSEQQLQDINTKLDAAHADAHSIGEELSNLRESITELEKINKTLEENIKSLNADNESLRATLSSTEEKFKSINAELEAAYSDSSSSSEELTELKESIESLQTTKTSLEQKLVELEAAEEENIVLQQRINELDHSKKELAESIENNEADRTETARKLKEFNQEKSIIIEKIGNSEELITALRSELESINNNTEQLKTEFGEATVTSQNTITQLTAQLEQAEAEHEKQIANLKQQLDVQISDHQKTNSTLEEVHSNLRNDRFDLETQLHEQRLLKEQAESIANATKLEIEGLRAELDAANQQLISANNNEPSAADSTQLQRLSSDLAKAVEFRKQSQISKQALQDDISEARKEIARLKGENDGHLELRIQLEGQLSVMRQQLNSGPATNQIFDNLKSLNDVSGIGHIPPTTDIGQTSWESKPAKRYNYIMVIAVFAAFMLIGLGSWLFKSQLGLEEEWETISQKIGLSENSVKTKQDSIAKIETVENRDASTSINQGTAITDTTPSTNITKIANATTQPVEKKASPIKPSSTSKKPLIAVTATSRDVTPIPFRVYRNALKDGGASPVMVEMPSGTFTMGSSVTSDFYEERPHRDVKIARFAVSKREVTFSEYVKFAKAAKKDVPEDEGWGRGNQPVINVSWHDASNYAAWLSEQTGNSYRLPSEAEWEYMARAGTQATYWWGNEPRGNYANCYDCQGKLTGKQALAVESYDANAFGIKNTAGNVAEWVQDCYHANYENAPLDSKAWVTNGICDKRMVRGGSFRSTLSQLRSSARDSFDITTRSESIGFRVVREY
ncbi:SUMF1/EgtB/PvdO family nonheme iron enzyme, partial [bacterium AH-315-E07]|nr:SUMF1/EgtB/PvdO family nonheme iron enzyme [bacterium AH-315-E07]